MHFQSSSVNLYFRDTPGTNMLEQLYTIPQVATIIALYWTVSISMVFVNKHLLSGFYGDMDLTVFVTWYQNVVTIVFIQLTGLFKQTRHERSKASRIDFQILFHKSFLKLSLTSVIMIIMNNLMLKHIGVAFYQVARSITLIFTLALSATMLNQPVTWRVSMSGLSIVLGYIIGINEENSIGTLSIWGIIYGLMASFSSAVCGIYIKRVGSIPNNDSLKQAYHTAINSCLLLSPLVYSTGQARQVIESDLVTSLNFWLMLTTSGTLSLALVWISILQIRSTSPVTHNISITGRSVIQTIIAVLYYNEQKTAWWWFGNLFVVFGVLWYAWMKSCNIVSSKGKEILI